MRDQGQVHADSSSPTNEEREKEGEKESPPAAPESEFTRRSKDIKLLPLGGKKKRRDSSPSKHFVGDHLGICQHPKVLRTLSKYSESRVLFTDVVFKISREGKPKERALLLSGNAVYVLKPETFKCGSRIDLAWISKVTLSTYADNFCLISLKGDHHHENDVLFTCAHKSEFVSTLLQGAKALLNLDIELAYANTMRYKFAAAYERIVTFEENTEQGSVHTKLSTQTIAPPPSANRPERLN